MKGILPGAERIGPRLQHNWDWRAAANFICGGAGGGLLLWIALAMPRDDGDRELLLAGLALVGLGLICVWFEIGRPWRALNVFRHGASSWMTREAAVACALFACGLVALWSEQPIAIGATAGLGLVFLYSQARILFANKGIPAWRHPRCVPLVIATGLAEGAGLLARAAALRPQSLLAARLLPPLAALRALAWRRYVVALKSDGAPAGALEALGNIDRAFVWAGNALPVLLAVAAVAIRQPLLAAAAGAAAAAAGVWLKYTLVCRAAFTQGFELPHVPVRGQGVPAPGVKPGWA